MTVGNREVGLSSRAFLAWGGGFVR